MVKFEKFGAIYCIFCVLVIVSDMQNLTYINIKLNLICHFSDQLTMMWKSSSIPLT